MKRGSPSTAVLLTGAFFRFHVSFPECSSYPGASKHPISEASIPGTSEGIVFGEPEAHTGMFCRSQKVLKVCSWEPGSHQIKGIAFGAREPNQNVYVFEIPWVFL